jgi:hypothetical protein
MSDEKVIHLNRLQAHDMKEEILLVRQHLWDEQSGDTERLNLLRDLIDALDVPERPI